MAEIELDSIGMEEVLTVMCRGAVDAAAASIALGITTKSGRVSRRSYTTDRAAAAVEITGRTALADEAREGRLIRAASLANLEVHGGI